MDNKEIKKDKEQSYTEKYRSLGMCFGVPLGVVYSLLFFPDNMAIGVCLGMPMGMCLGMAIGAAKDNKLAQKKEEENISESEAV